MESETPIPVNVEFLTGMLLKIAQERSVEQLLQYSVRRVLDLPAPLISVIWLIDSEKEPITGTSEEELSSQTRYLYAVVGGSSAAGARKQRTRLPDHLTRVPLGVGPIGKIAATRQPLTITDLDKAPEEFSTVLDWLRVERELAECTEAEERLRESDRRYRRYRKGLWL